MRSSCVIYLYPFTKKYKKGAFAEAKASPLYIYLFIKEDHIKYYCVFCMKIRIFEAYRFYFTILIFPMMGSSFASPRAAFTIPKIVNTNIGTPMRKIKRLMYQGVAIYSKK